MQSTDKKLKEIKTLLDEAEQKIISAKRILFEQVYQEQAVNLELKNTTANTGQVIEGVFDGESMIDKEGKKHSVPANYASKSKLIPGDQLKLNIMPDGTFVYKQINLIDRKRNIGVVLETNGMYQVLVDGKKRNVLQASITYFKAKPGDKVSVITPKMGESDWVAVENCLGSKVVAK